MLLLATTLSVAFTTLIVIDNQELRKIFTTPLLLNLGLISGSVIPIISVNYMTALKGRNFQHWLTEVLLVVGFIFLYLAIVLPHAFPASVEDIDKPFWKFWNKDLVEPNLLLGLVGLLTVVFFVSAFLNQKKNS